MHNYLHLELQFDCILHRKTQKCTKKTTTLTPSQHYQTIFSAKRKYELRLQIGMESAISRYMNKYRNAYRMRPPQGLASLTKLLRAQCMGVATIERVERAHPPSAT